MIPIATWSSLSFEEKKRLLSRPVLAQKKDLKKDVSDIVYGVKNGGQEALLEYARRFDDSKLDSFLVSKKEIEEAKGLLSEKEVLAIKRAYEQIFLFHHKGLPLEYDHEATKGVRVWKRFRPIERVGLYIPGGTAPLPSTVLMLGVPAMIAGCATKVLCTPQRQDGSVHPAILYAAKLCGIEKIFKVGGAHAVAAMAYGTCEVPKVDKIFGPGNAYVTQAKLIVSEDKDGAALDMPAGPSEVMVLADDKADASFVASDLLSQAEHGEDSQVVVISTSQKLLEEVLSELKEQLPLLSRKDICQKALTHARMILVDQLNEAFDIANQYAPEHLILQIASPEDFEPLIKNAGSVFLGAYTPETMGDYVSGSNHVLPTYGYANTYSGLDVKAFMKHITFQMLSKEGLYDLGFTAKTLAHMEGLTAHENAVAIRLKEIEKNVHKGVRP